MLSTGPELIWQGRIHLGDEPGVYGDALYAGLCTELPITLTMTPTPGPDITTLVLETDDVRTFSGYPGHLVTVTLYEPHPTQPDRWREDVLLTERLMSSDNNCKQIDVDLAGRTSPYYISVRVRIDTEVPPGLYDDFVLRRLSNKSADFRFVASLGFHQG